MSEFRRRLMMTKSGGGGMPDYLCFTALSSSTITRDGTYAANLEYSKNGVIWNTFDENTTISLDTDEVAYFRGNNTTLANTNSNYTKFVMTGSLNASGNIMSLLNPNTFENISTIPYVYCFFDLFYGCSSLKSAPKLPAITLKSNCYQQMFYDCTGLTAAPELPATTLAAACYESMFRGCSNLLSAPTELPATSGANRMYYAMFYGCNKLLTSPVLPMENLSNSNVYREMFRNASRLNYITMLATSITGSYTLTNWVNGVQTTSGIFVKHIDATWTTTGVSGVPSNWTIIYYNPTTDKYYLSDKTTECDDHGNPL